VLKKSRIVTSQDLSILHLVKHHLPFQVAACNAPEHRYPSTVVVLLRLALSFVAQRAMALRPFIVFYLKLQSIFSRGTS
jgi:hypothetical protein